MNAINRQKFLAELSKLLTFMYEEDRLRALNMYERMFDITEDEQGLIQHLMSPTRQAVIIARAYDDKERKLSVSSQSRGDADGLPSGEVPKFVLAINKIFDDLFPDEPEEALEEDQVSFFDMGLAEKEDFIAARPAVPAGAVLLSDTQQFRLDAVVGEAEDEEAPDDDAAEADAFAPAEEAGDAAPLPEEIPAEEAALNEDGAAEDLLAGASIDELISSWKKDLEAEETGAVAREASGAENAPAAPDEPAFPEDDAFLPEEIPLYPVDVDAPGEESALPSGAEDPDDDEAEPGDFASADAPFPPYADGAQAPEGDAPDFLPAEEPAADTPDAGAEDAEAPGEDGEDGDQEEDGGAAASKPVRRAPARRQEAPVRRETSAVKLVLFLIVAIPLTLALLALLLIPAALFLGVAVSLAALGGTLASAAFHSFSVFADLLLLLGTALVVFALALLFFFLAVSVVWSGMGGLIRWVVGLGRKFCTKEAPAV